MSENADQKTYWNEVAGAKWVANQAKLDRLMAPLTEALLDAVGPAEGVRLIDVGCGCGDLSLQLAERVGPTGRVLGIDVSRPMLAQASSRSQASALGARAPIAWLEADAMTYEFDAVYDVMVSRFGVMFFEDKTRAFANLRTGIKADGRFAFLAWRGRAEIDWFQTPLKWVASVLPMPDPIDGEVGPCGLADGEATRRLLMDAGFRGVTATKVDRPLLIGDTVDEAFALLIAAGPVAALMRDANAHLRGAAEKVLRRGLERQAHNGRVELGGSCWIYQGTA